MVGRTLATKLVELGHDVRMGSRTKDRSRSCCVLSAGRASSTWATSLRPAAPRRICCSGSASTARSARRLSTWKSCA